MKLWWASSWRSISFLSDGQCTLNRVEATWIKPYRVACKEWPPYSSNYYYRGAILYKPPCKALFRWPQLYSKCTGHRKGMIWTFMNWPITVSCLWRRSRLEGLYEEFRILTWATTPYSILANRVPRTLLGMRLAFGLVLRGSFVSKSRQASFICELLLFFMGIWSCRSTTAVRADHAVWQRCYTPPRHATAYTPPPCDAHWNQENFVPFKAQRKSHVTLTAFQLNCVPNCNQV